MEFTEKRNSLKKNSVVIKKESVGTLQANKTLTVKKLNAPSFSGNIRDYPNFKKDYLAHMIPTFGEDPFALRSCLTGKALELIQGVGDDYTEMMMRLELRFGCSEKLVDAILKDIDKLKKVPDGDSVKFLQLVEVIEKSWLDLKAMKLERERVPPRHPSTGRA